MVTLNIWNIRFQVRATFDTMRPGEMFRAKLVFFDRFGKNVEKLV